MNKELSDTAPTPERTMVIDVPLERPSLTVRTVWNYALNAITTQRLDIDYYDTQQSEARPVRRPAWPVITFLALVILPSLVSQVYLAFVASDQYVAEARFAVRTSEIESPLDKLQSSMSSQSLGATPVFSSSTQYAYIVSNYIRSRAMVDDIMRVVDLREIFRRPGADAFARLPKGATIEDIYEYWKSMVTCYVDAPSGIVKVQVLSFQPDDSVTIANAILHLGEKLVNQLSVRAHNDAMRLAEQEVQRAEGSVRAALNNLRKYRDFEGFIDPTKTADETAKLLVPLLAEKIKLESDYFVAIRSMAKDAPSAQNLKNRLDGLEVQINLLKSKLTGNSTQRTNIAGALSRFEDLELQRRFSEKLYTMAQDGLERARMLAERQSIYLIVFVPPGRPEEAAFPRRLAYSLVIPLLLSVLWGIGALIAASIEDHRI